MNAQIARQGGALPPPPPHPSPQPESALARPQSAREALPQRVVDALWRANELSDPVVSTITSGYPTLDAELPGAGWPCRSITELLQPQPGVLELRLLAPSLRLISDKDIILIGPPRELQAAGFVQAGIDERRLVWIRTDTPARRLWCTEQLIKSGSFGALISWLPQARPEQIRRLQVCAQSAAPVFLCRPTAAQHEASAAPLRVAAALGADWELDLHILKRRGPVHEGVLHLSAIPGTLSTVLTPRMSRPSRLISRTSVQQEAADAVGSTVIASHRRRASVSQ